MGQQHAAIRSDKHIGGFNVAMYDITVMRVLYGAAQLLHNRQRLHCGKLASHLFEQVVQRAAGDKWRHSIEQPFALAKLQEWQDIWMLKLADLFSLGHKIFTESRALRVARAKHLHRYFIIALANLATAIHIGYAPSADTLDEEEIAQLHAFKKIRHLTPHNGRLVSSSSKLNAIRAKFRRAGSNSGERRQVINQKYCSDEVVFYGDRDWSVE